MGSGMQWVLDICRADVFLKAVFLLSLVWCSSSPWPSSCDSIWRFCWDNQKSHGLLALKSWDEWLHEHWQTAAPIEPLGMHGCVQFLYWVKTPQQSCSTMCFLSSTESKKIQEMTRQALPLEWKALGKWMWNDWKTKVELEVASWLVWLIACISMEVLWCMGTLHPFQVSTLSHCRIVLVAVLGLWEAAVSSGWVLLAWAQGHMVLSY